MFNLMEPRSSFSCLQPSPLGCFTDATSACIRSLLLLFSFLHSLLLYFDSSYSSILFLFMRSTSTTLTILLRCTKSSLMSLSPSRRTPFNYDFFFF